MKGKKVLFVEHNLRNEKLGIMYLAGSLASAGHHADLVRVGIDNVDDRLRDYKPDFLAFSITTGNHKRALETAREVKLRHRIPSVFGGPHCTFFPEFSSQPEVDFMVTGQGEQSIVDIVEGRVRPGVVHGHVAEHPDELPPPDRRLFYQYPEFRNNPIKNLITSRACPYRCSYCFNHSFLELTRSCDETQRWFRRRSVSSVMHEIEEIRKDYPLEKIFFFDDSFIQDLNWLRVFVEEYSSKVHLPWFCALRANRLTDDIAEGLFASGLEMINYALESADPDVQRFLLNRGQISNADIIRAIHLFEKFGVRARMQNMIGLPLRNPLEDALNTLQFNINHRVTDSWCSIFQPYPRTALGQYCLEHGFISDDQLGTCSESFFDESRLNIPDKDQIYTLQKLWYFIIRAAIPLELVQILIRARISKQLGDELQALRFKCSQERLYGLSPGKTQTIKSVPEGNSADLGSILGRALARLDLPEEFILLLCKAEFSERDKKSLMDYINGVAANVPPLYTVDDKSGELKDERISIWKRGGTPDDILQIPPSRFMRFSKAEG